MLVFRLGQAWTPGEGAVASQAEQLAIATAAALDAGPIHEPLREMGFSDAHIRRARQALNIRVDDTGARSINRYFCLKQNQFNVVL